MHMTTLLKLINHLNRPIDVQKSEFHLDQEINSKSENYLFEHCRSLSADYFLFQPYIDQFFMEPIDLPGNFPILLNEFPDKILISIYCALLNKTKTKNKQLNACVRWTALCAHLSIIILHRIREF